jgi:ferredoxin
MPRAVFVNDKQTENEQDSASCLLVEGGIIFDLFEKSGTTLPHGCLAGSCGACRIQILEGVQLLEPASEREKQTIDSILKHQNLDHLSEKEKSFFRLSCRAKIKNLKSNNLNSDNNCEDNYEDNYEDNPVLKFQKGP